MFRPFRTVSSRSATPRDPCVAVSQDGKAVVAGYGDASLVVWELPAGRVMRDVQPTKKQSASSPMHSPGSALVHVSFLESTSELISADDEGVIIVHSLSRVPLLIGDKRSRIHGRLPDGSRPPVVTSIFALSVCATEKSDDHDWDLVAFSTPYKLAIMTLRPEVTVQYKLVWTKDATRSYDSSATTTPLLSIDDGDRGTFSCAVWSPVASGPLRGTASPGFRFLACSRGRQLYLLKIELARMTGSGSGRRAQEPKFGFQTTVEQSVQVADPVVGLWFVGHEHLLVMDASETLALFAVPSLSRIGGESVAAMNIVFHNSFGTALAALGASQVVAYNHTIAVLGAKILALAAGGLLLGGCVPWHTRIDRLLAENRWTDALAFARQLLDNPQSAAVFAGDKAFSASAVQSFAVERLATFVRRQLDASNTARGDDSDNLEDRIHDCARIAIESCVQLGRQDALVAEFFDIFSERGLRDAYFDVLHPAILEDALAGVAIEPSFLDALTKSRISRGLFAHLEDDLLHLDTGLVNVDQVVVVCRARRLWRAFAHVYNRQLGDYITPLIELFRLVQTRTDEMHTSEQTGRDGVALGTTDEASEEECYLLYVYLTYILTGKSFPRGLDQGASALSAKQDCWNLLLSPHFIVWPPVHVQGPLLGVDRSVRLGKEPFPYLALALTYDGTAFFSMLGSVFEDTSLSGELWVQPFNDGGSRGQDAIAYGYGIEITRQTVLDTLFHLLLPEHAEGSVEEPQNWASVPEPQRNVFAEAHRMHFVCFTLRAIRKYSTFVSYDDHTVNLLLRLACTSSDQATFELRESCAREVVDWQLHTVARSQRWLGRDERSFEANMDMFQSAGFYRAAEALAREWGRLDRVVDCYALDPLRRDEAFRSIRTLLGDARKSAAQSSQLLGRVVSHAPQLARDDPRRTAELLDLVDPSSHSAVVPQLEDEAVRFEYLKAILDAPTYGQRGGRALHAALFEGYIDLMCRFDPSSVLRYLRDVNAVHGQRPFSLVSVGAGKPHMPVF
ncbi:Golgi CORVET complex core vacuolar protein 8-domain-containing protein [Hyaloraphidium curvatum]|nr:Golgi CORVET complex core vacuolar protein 8-domain-containing protein [Hyaloraphidium curvatum]